MAGQEAFADFQFTDIGIDRLGIWAGIAHNFSVPNSRGHTHFPFPFHYLRPSPRGRNWEDSAIAFFLQIVFSA